MQVLQLGLGSKPINSEDFYGIDRKPSEVTKQWKIAPFSANYPNINRL